MVVYSDQVQSIQRITSLLMYSLSFLHPVKIFPVPSIAECVAMILSVSTPIIASELMFAAATPDAQKIVVENMIILFVLSCLPLLLWKFQIEMSNDVAFLIYLGESFIFAIWVISGASTFSKYDASYFFNLLLAISTSALIDSLSISLLDCVKSAMRKLFVVVWTTCSYDYPTCQKEQISSFLMLVFSIWITCVSLVADNIIKSFMKRRIAPTRLLNTPLAKLFLEDLGKLIKALSSTTMLMNSTMISELMKKSSTRKQMFLRQASNNNLYEDVGENMVAYDLGYFKKFESSNCSELLWRIARVLCEKGKLAKNPGERMDIFYEAYAVIQNALEHEPADGSFGSHKWYAILLDYIGEIEGSKSHIAKSYEVREHLERALTIYGDDATTCRILGLWHLSFADMGYATRLVTKAIFGTPPASTYEQALHCLLRAEELAPGFYSTNTYYIGVVFNKMGRKEESVEYFKKSFKMPVITADDEDIQKKAHEELRKAGVKDSEMV